MGAKEEKEKAKTAKESLGKFFYDIAKMTFGTMVLGEFVAMFGIANTSYNSVVVLFLGSLMTAGFVYLGNLTLKR